ncbi:MAG TPA: hypothetical protein DDZ66_09010 [Firmicutes bacterium]|nr:hypothetical protein [Bacillota bacterium]
MHFRGFRVQRALLVFVVVFIVGLGVQYLHQQTQVIHPLREQLQDIPGVLSIELEEGPSRRGSRMLVSLDIEQDASLAIVFERVYQTLISTGGDYAIRVQDAPNSAILSLFQRIQIALEEAIMTGEFTALEARVQELADTAGVAWQLGLDREFVYLSLTEGENTLRRVISRDTDQGKIQVFIDGGVHS